jgi:hypothetical protein
MLIPALVTVQDKSWRVRFNVANQLVTLCDALGKEVTRWAAGAPVITMQFMSRVYSRTHMHVDYQDCTWQHISSMHQT